MTTRAHFEHVVRSANGLDILDNAYLRARTPSLFAKHPVKGVSDKYGFVDTQGMMKAMETAGFGPTEVRQYAKRDVEARQYARHLIRFRKLGARPAKIGDCVPQVVLINSHDRTARFQLMGGLYRLACSNGLLVSTSNVVEPIAIRHTTNVVQDLIDNVQGLIKGYTQIGEHVTAMQALVMTERTARSFAALALGLRSRRRAGAMEAHDLLTPRRAEDEALTLWNVYNRVQENLTKGGLLYATATGRKAVSKPMNSIKTDLRVNAGLWELAMGVLESKGKVSA